MAYDAALVLTALSQLQSVYHSAFFLNGKTTGEPGVGNGCTRLIKNAEWAQRGLIATGYPVPDDWLTKPCDIAIGQPDANLHCSAVVVVDAQLPAILEQIRKAVMRVQTEIDILPKPVIEASDNEQPETTDKVGKGVAPRNAWFLEQYESSGTDTYHKPKRIQELWWNMTAQERAAICPDASQRVSRPVVETGIKTARKLRK